MTHHESLQVLRALRDVGIDVDSVFDLVNSPQPYPEAIPILVYQLSQGISDDENLREGIVRALSVKEAIGIAAPTLLAEFRKTPVEKSLIRWTIGNAIAVTMTDGELDEVLRIIKDRNNGIARQMLVFGLGRFQGNEVVESVLIDLLDDDQVVIQAIKALDKFNSQKALPTISDLAEHGPPPVRKAAQQFAKRKC